MYYNFVLFLQIYYDSDTYASYNGAQTVYIQATLSKVSAYQCLQN